MYMRSPRRLIKGRNHKKKFSHAEGDWIPKVLRQGLCLNFPSFKLNFKGGGGGGMTSFGPAILPFCRPPFSIDARAYYVTQDTETVVL